MTDRANIVETLQRYAPEHYDWMSDDMTVPFAIELAKKDAELAKLRAALKPFALLADFERKRMPDIRSLESVLVAYRLLRNAADAIAVEQSQKESS